MSPAHTRAFSRFRPRYRSCGAGARAGYRRAGARLCAGVRSAVAHHGTLYLPTQRAGRLVREVFLDVLQTEAALLRGSS